MDETKYNLKVILYVVLGILGVIAFCIITMHPKFMRNPYVITAFCVLILLAFIFATIIEIKKNKYKTNILILINDIIFFAVLAIYFKFILSYNVQNKTIDEMLEAIDRQFLYNGIFVIANLIHYILDLFLRSKRFLRVPVTESETKSE